jgi:hypothetical protein
MDFKQHRVKIGTRERLSVFTIRSTVYNGELTPPETKTVQFW